jgi:hypothetical protein
MVSFMGVIYKLKQEVIDYILKIKSDDQGLSCRKISELASAHFQKPISKSSVNAVLKDSSLSSPIGRRAKKGLKAEKFKIPEHRKEQIFVNIPPIFLEKKEALPALAAPKDTPPIENLGVLLLKAAEWQVKRQGLLRFLCEKFGPVTCEEKILKLSEAFLFLPLFGEHQSESFVRFDKKSLWQVSDVHFEPASHQKKECLDILLGLDEKKRSVALEYSQLFSEASYFRFALEDGSSFCIDAQMNASWASDSVHGDFSLCLEKSFDNLSRCFISNISPIILRETAAAENLPAYFLEMLSAFENLPGKRIKQIDVMTSANEALSSFDKVIVKKRSYVVGLYNCQGLLSHVPAEKGQPPKHVQSPLTEEEYSFQEAETAFRLSSGQQISAKVYFLSLRKDQSPKPQFAILTNIPSHIKSSEEVIGEFLKKYPDPMKGHAYFQDRQKQHLQSCCDIVSFSDEKKVPGDAAELFQSQDFPSEAANILLRGLHDYCCRHFFHANDRTLSLKEALKRFYGLSGEFTKDQDVLKIKLIVPSAYPYQKELDFLIQRVNETGAFDPTGHRMVIGT